MPSPAICWAHGTVVGGLRAPTAQTQGNDMKGSNQVLRALSVALIALLCSVGRVAAVVDDNRGLGLAWEFTDGELTLYVAGARLSDVAEVHIGTEVLDVLHLQNATEENDAVVIPIGAVHAASDLVDISVLLADGSSVSLAIDTNTLPKSSCDVPLIYSTRRCGSASNLYATAPNYPCCDNNRNGTITDSGDGNCTWFAAFMAKGIKGWVVPKGWGNAGTWCSRAGQTPGWTVSSTPTANTIACVQRIGHVGWVAGISSDRRSVTLIEQNCSTWSNLLGRCFSSGTRTKTYSIAGDSIRFIRCSTSNGCR